MDHNISVKKDENIRGGFEPSIDLYLDLLKRSLLGEIYSDYSTLYRNVWWKRMIQDGLSKFGYELVKQMNPTDRKEGVDWPKLAQTMIGEKRMDNIKFCVEKILADGIPGDFIETGVWRGGACIYMRGILKAHGINNRKVWVADSFEGLPPATLEVDKSLMSGNYNLNNEVLGVSMENVRENFKRYNLLDDQVCFLKGWFKDTLPEPPFKQLAMARLDGDLYESTRDAIENIYPRLSVGGFLIVDDYGSWESCRIAVDEYRKKFGINEVITVIDTGGIYWRKEQSMN